MLQAAQFPSSCTGPGDTGVPWPVGSEALEPSGKSQHELLAGAVAARASLPCVTGDLHSTLPRARLSNMGLNWWALHPPWAHLRS